MSDGSLMSDGSTSDGPPGSIAPQLKGHWYLVGMPGAGKSTVAVLLGDRVHRYVADTDRVVEESSGRLVHEIFATDGEAAFRAREAAALAELASRTEPLVVAVGGGAVLDPSSRQLMARTGTVIHLRAETTTLVARVGDGHDRPLLAPSPVVALGRLEAERRACYAELASVSVDVDGCAPSAVADRVVEAMADLVSQGVGR